MDSWAPSVDFAAPFLCENVVSGSYCLQRKAPAGGGGGELLNLQRWSQRSSLVTKSFQIFLSKKILKIFWQIKSKFEILFCLYKIGIKLRITDPGMGGARRPGSQSALFHVSSQRFQSTDSYQSKSSPWCRSLKSSNQPTNHAARMHYIGSGLCNANKIRTETLRRYTFLKHLKARHSVTNDISNWFSKVNPNLLFVLQREQRGPNVWELCITTICWHKVCAHNIPKEATTPTEDIFKVYPGLALLPSLLLATRRCVGPHLPAGAGSELVMQASERTPTNMHSLALLLRTACVSS